MIEHYSHKIQNAIQKELFKANSSIKIAVAWFTNVLLFQPLLLKLGAGVSVELILNKDDINCSDDNEVDFDEFVKAGDDAAKAQWFPLDKVPSLAFDHDLILREATNELRRQIHFEPIGFELLPEKFTMTQLQHLYEAILSVKFDRRNFCNKMLKLGILTQLEETLPMPNKKVAFLYKFNPENYNEMKEKGFRLEF